MKRFMIRCDIEGASGVVSYAQAEPERAEFEFGKAMFMSDLSALIEGLNEGGAGEIWIYDQHYYGRNIDISHLPANCRTICGKPPYKNNWAGGLDCSFCGLILLGFHSKNGSGQLLHHTYEPDIKDLVLDGTSVGEIGMEAAVGGDQDVPVLMITGDSAGIGEARELCPNIVGVCVKESLSPEGGICYSARKTASEIAQAASAIARKPPAVQPYQTPGNELEVHFNPGPYLDEFKRLFSCGDSISIQGSSATDCWAKYLEMKIRAQEKIR